MEFNWEDFKNHKIGVHCKTEEEAKEFIKECYKHGIEWQRSNGDITTTKWSKKGDRYYACTDEHFLYTNFLIFNPLYMQTVEYKKKDNKMELKEGMIIECRNGNRYLLRNVRGELLLSANQGWTKCIYDNNFIDIEEDASNGHYDIMKIYKSEARTLQYLFDNQYLTCIWERKEPKKMTLAQISEALGYEVEVIDNE